MDRAIVLFDGVCNLCDRTVQFVIDHDPRAHFAFASLQSETGRALLARHGLPAPREGEDPGSVILVEGDRAYDRSTAALRIARNLGWPWKALVIFLAFPRFLRDPFYELVARHRYQWFGKSDACRVPTPELRARFLE